MSSACSTEGFDFGMGGNLARVRATSCEVWLVEKHTPLGAKNFSAYFGHRNELTAVDGGVADVLALDDVDDVFGDVGGVVADALEIFGDED